MVRKAVVKYRSLRSNLIHLPLSLYATLAQQQIRPQSLIVHLSAPNGGKSAHLGWSGLAAASSLASFGDSSGVDETLEMDPEVAMSYGWREGQIVELSLIHNPPKAASVSVTPLSVDDWEILERHADFLEMNLLAQLRAASKGQVVDVWVKGKSKIRVKIDETSPPTSDSTAVLVNPSTEIYVAPRVRTAEAPSAKTASVSSTPLSSVTQILDGMTKTEPTEHQTSRLLRSLPCRIATEWGMSEPELGMAYCSPVTFSSTSKKLGAASEELIVALTKVEKSREVETGPAESSTAAQESTANAEALVVKLQPRIDVPNGHVLLSDPADGADSWCRFRVTLSKDALTKRATNSKGKERERDERANLFAVDASIAAGFEYLQRAQALAQSRTQSRPLPVRPLLVVGAKGSGRTSVALEIARRAERDRGLMTDIMHVQVNRLPRDARLGSLKERFRDWLDEAKLRRPCVLFLDDLDTMLGPESELAQSSQPEIIANTFADLLTALPPNSGVFVIATALGEDALHPVLAARHTFGQVVKLKSLSKESRGKILSGLVASKLVTSTATISLQEEGEAEQLDFVTLGGMTEGYSVTDLQDLVSNALQQGIIRQGSSPLPLVLQMSDFEQAQEGFTPLSLRDVKLHHSDVRWSDIGGLHETRRVLRETLEWPTKYGPIFASCPLRLRSGLLLYGFPGCGKTLLASAVAKECGLNFISVKGPEILNKYIGASEKSVRDLFERASAAKPCVLFFDEFDSIAPKRGHDSTGVTDRVVNQMLTQMDGAEGLDGVYVLAATSRPDLIDPALLRPGRLDKSLICDMPSVKEREEILRAVSVKLDVGPDVDFQEIASSTEGYSGADLQALVYNAHLDMVHSSMLPPTSLQPDGKGKGKLGSSTAQQPQPSFLTYPESLSKTMSAAEKAAMQQRLNKILGASHAVDDKPQVHVNHLKTIHHHHLLKSLETARPSVPAEERVRLQKIYASFVAERSGKLANGDAGRDTGSRVSLM